MSTARTRLGPILLWPGARATPCPLVTLLTGRWSREQEARYAAETERLKTVVASVRAARGSWTSPDETRPQDVRKDWLNRRGEIQSPDRRGH